MKALKWLGYLLAAVAVLSVVAGIGLAIVAVVTIGGTIFAAVCLVVLTASQLRNLSESSETSEPEEQDT